MAIAHELHPFQYGLPDHIRILNNADEANWKRVRRGIIGASEAAAITGSSKHDTETSVFAKKMGLEPDDQENDLFWWGHKAEANIAEWYQRETGRPVRNLGDYCIVYNPKYPWLGATLDRLTMIDGKPAPLEIKNRAVYVSDQWDYEVPEDVLTQVHVQMICCDMRQGSVAVCIGGNKGKWADVEYNEAFAEELIEATRRFYENHMKTGVAPEPSGNWEKDRAALRLLHPDDNGETVQWERLAELDAEILARKKIVDEEVEEIEKAKNKIIAMMGDATFIKDGVLSYSHKTQERRGAVSVDPLDIPKLKAAGIDYKLTDAKAFRVLRRHDKRGK